MKNTTILIVIILIVLVGAIFVYANSGKNSNDITNSGDSANGEAQKIVISMKNYNYYPNTITVKANQPVEITLDNSVKGCYRSFTIPQLNIAKRLSTTSDKLVFTPTEKGTYRFACSMGMGYGTLIVE